MEWATTCYWFWVCTALVLLFDKVMVDGVSLVLLLYHLKSVYNVRLVSAVLTLMMVSLVPHARVLLL